MANGIAGLKLARRYPVNLSNLSLLRKLKNGKRRAHGIFAMSAGRIAACRPLSMHYGDDRGTPVDRYYIDKFLSAHAADLRGRVLEVGEDSYSRRFGGVRIERQEVLHLHHGHPGATITGDITDPSTLAAQQFDCILFMQTLELVFDFNAAVANLRRALRPGGVLLLTASGVTAICNNKWRNSFYWMFTPRALKGILESHFDSNHVSVEGFGNLYAATAFLHCAAVQDLSQRKLDRLPDPEEPEYVIVTGARAVA
jgi:SAM-dependent methyltransferase